MFDGGRTTAGGARCRINSISGRKLNRRADLAIQVLFRSLEVQVLPNSCSGPKSWSESSLIYCMKRFKNVVRGFRVITDVLYEKSQKMLCGGSESSLIYCTFFETVIQKRTALILDDTVLKPFFGDLRGCDGEISSPMSFLATIFPIGEMWAIKVRLTKHRNIQQGRCFLKECRMPRTRGPPSSSSCSTYARDLILTCTASRGLLL